MASKRSKLEKNDMRDDKNVSLQGWGVRESESATTDLKNAGVLIHEYLPN
jgi:hypothetical protein